MSVQIGDDAPLIDETHDAYLSAVPGEGRICRHCGACTCHPKDDRDITTPCPKDPLVESEHPRGYVIDPSTIIEDEAVAWAAEHIIGIDPGDSEAKPVHYEIDADGKFTPVNPEESEPLRVTGGWCAPSDNFYPGLDLPEVTARRGGISFTSPKPLTKKQLRARNDNLQAALSKVQAENRKLRKRNRRLLRLIEKGL